MCWLSEWSANLKTEYTASQRNKMDLERTLYRNGLQDPDGRYQKSTRHAAQSAARGVHLLLGSF